MDRAISSLHPLTNIKFWVGGKQCKDWYGALRTYSTVTNLPALSLLLLIDAFYQKLYL